MEKVENLHQHLLKKRSYNVLLLFVTILFGTSAQAAHLFKAHLSGSNEVHSVLSPANGQIWGRLDGSELKVWGEFAGLQGDFDASIAGGSHIHTGYAGENGGIALSLTVNLDSDMRGGSYDSLDNTFTLTAAQQALLENRQLYVNIHTTAHAAGELRGQLVSAASKVYHTKAYGSNEVHKVLSNGSGAFVFELQGNELMVSGSFMNLEADFDASIAGGIHLHNAMAGKNGGVTLALDASVANDLRSGVLNIDDNTYTLSNAQVEMLKNRGMYINIHTTQHAAGELRGQVVPQTHALFRTFLTGTAQTPVATTKAHGQLVVEYWNDSIAVSGAFDDLSSTLDTALFGGAHIHTGLAGQSGAVAIVLNIDYDADYMGGSLNADDNLFALSASQRNGLFERMMYANIHTTKFGAGEIRGQLLPTANYYFNAVLSGAQETHNVVSGAAGNLVAEVHGDWLVLSGAFSALESDFDANIAGGAHIHAALPGSDGEVKLLLDAETSSDMRSGTFAATDNMWQVSSGLLDTLKARWHYVNLHTKDQQAGELRGQLLAESSTYLWSKLSGTSHSPAVNTKAQGGAAVEIRGGNLVLAGSFNNLDSEFDANIAGGAHIHKGLPGQNGGIWQGLMANLTSDNLSGTFEAEDNAWSMGDEAIDSLLGRWGYINIHTTENAAGAIRGQVLQSANAYFTTTLSSTNQVPYLIDEGMGAMKFELNGDQLTAVGSFAGINSMVDVSIAGGAHLHAAQNGENGNVIFPLNLGLASDGKAGWFNADSNQIALTSAQMNTLKSNGMYVNIHSMDHASGILRGQVVADVNWFPENDATITAPANGMKVTLMGDGNTAINVEWDEATSPDNQRLTYRWQLASDEEFSSVLYDIGVGTDTEVEITYAWLDSMLNDLGVLIGVEQQLYHRVIASDGNVQTAGEKNDITAERAVIIGLDETTRNAKEANRYSVYPTIANDRFYVQGQVEGATQANVTVYSITGEKMVETSLQNSNDTGRKMISTFGFGAGTYIVVVQSADGTVQRDKVMVQ